MTGIVFDKFDNGLDLRRGASTSEANRLRSLRNCYVTTGKEIKKRPGMIKVATLEAGTRGLKAGNGKLNTFYEAGTVTHANPLFQAHKVMYPGTPSEVVRAWYCDAFNGYLYVAIEYANGDVRHHYLNDPGAWAASTVYALDAVRRPATANGLLYKVTTGGTSAAAEPTWPTTFGGTVADGTVTWTCVGTAIEDANCPHGKGVTKAASKIWATKKVEPFDTVRFCAVDNPRDWTLAGDAGYLAVALKQENAQYCNALGQFKDNLVAFFQDSAQLWTVDVDPANNAIDQRIFGVGTRHPATPTSFSDDVFFLADQGVRSITVNAVTANLQDTDVGSPVDSLVVPAITASPQSIYVPALGQFWLVLGNIVFAYSFSRTSKLAAWSEYTFPFIAEDVAVLDNETYVRYGDDVYRFDEGAYTDNGNPIDVEIKFPFLDFKIPGVLKMITGMDMVLQGSASVSLLTNPNDDGQSTPPVIVSGDTRSGTLIPVESCATAIAPVIRNALNEPFKFTAISFFFEKLANL